MSHNITRKPVPSAAATAAPPPPAAHVPPSRDDVSEDDLAKDLEKSAFSVSRTRVSTEIDEPLPPYYGNKNGRAGFGDNVVTEKLKSFRFKNLKFGAGAGAAAQGQQKKIFGIRRRTFLIGVAVFIIAILALAIGLGVGLKKSKYANARPQHVRAHLTQATEHKTSHSPQTERSTPEI
jgi:preprotein translocase subunit SecG